MYVRPNNMDQEKNKYKHIRIRRCSGYKLEIIIRMQGDEKKMQIGLMIGKRRVLVIFIVKQRKFRYLIQRLFKYIPKDIEAASEEKSV